MKNFLNQFVKTNRQVMKKKQLKDLVSLFYIVLAILMICFSDNHLVFGALGALFMYFALYYEKD